MNRLKKFGLELMLGTSLAFGMAYDGNAQNLNDVGDINNLNSPLSPLNPANPNCPIYPMANQASSESKDDSETNMEFYVGAAYGLTLLVGFGCLMRKEHKIKKK